MSQSGLKRAVFFDRDGVINESPGEGYVLRWADFHFRPGLFDAMRAAQGFGYLLFVITNQRCVGKGLITRAELDSIHHEMSRRLEQEGISLQHIYAYTGLASDGYGAKPRPDFFFEAAENHQIDLHASWMIGDQERDRQAALAAELKGFIGVKSEKPSNDTYVEVENLAAQLTAKLPQ